MPRLSLQILLHMNCRCNPQTRTTARTNNAPCLQNKVPKLWNADPGSVLSNRGKTPFFRQG